MVGAQFGGKALKRDLKSVEKVRLLALPTWKARPFVKYNYEGGECDNLRGEGDTVVMHKQHHGADERKRSPKPEKRGGLEVHLRSFVWFKHA